MGHKYPKILTEEDLNPSDLRKAALLPGVTAPPPPPPPDPDDLVTYEGVEFSRQECFRTGALTVIFIADLARRGDPHAIEFLTVFKVRIRSKGKMFWSFIPEEIYRDTGDPHVCDPASEQGGLPGGENPPAESGVRPSDPQEQPGG